MDSWITFKEGLILNTVTKMVVSEDANTSYITVQDVLGYLKNGNL